jgi:predicted flavoprotein YhiN
MRRDTEGLVTAIKAAPLTLAGSRTIDEAISTAGGLSWEALTPELMLKDVPGVFCAGEMLDWDAPTGGYLITACFATGRWAGRAAADYLSAKALS